MNQTLPNKTAALSGPDQIPHKFRDPNTGALRSAALIKSYLELEKKLAAMVAVPGPGADPAERQAFNAALGVPAKPEEYQVEIDNEMIEIDPEVNARLHAAGFTPAQTQLVYDLASERLLPAVERIAGDFAQEREFNQLCEHLGGKEKLDELAPQIAAWGKANLPDDVYQALASSCQGVIALQAMMSKGEPGLAREGQASAPASEAELKRLMADPRYWRDKDSVIVAQVKQGFERLFPGETPTSV